jgi:predicted NAD-dependent protein-ADP-ribosyltransferase YbiA (DUF1768 family)
MTVPAAQARTVSPGRDLGHRPAADDDRAASPENWPGLNLLGFALMEMRHQLRDRA